MGDAVGIVAKTAGGVITADPLIDRIKRQIKVVGPLSIAEYMALCISDPDSGYYTTTNPIGQAGDFITAPEISQMFGELIGIWCIAMWRNIGAPGKFALVEMGPGHGTLMADLLRSTSIDQAFCHAVEVQLLEISEVLKGAQKNALSDHTSRITWIDTLDAVGDIPALIIGNEFLDALPLRQYVKSEGFWHERMVGLQDGNLAFHQGVGLLDPALLPDDHELQVNGSVFEISPARKALTDDLGQHINQHGGAALLIDYGHTVSGFGDTFQAVAAHQFARPLDDPGKVDLTSHVDFAALANAISNTDGLNVQVSTQAEFLLTMGLQERAGSLGNNKSLAEQQTLQQAVQRLTGPDEMGDLFKVFSFARDGVEIAGFS